MTSKEVRLLEREHMSEPKIRFRYKGRFLVCDHCQQRFRQRFNGTLHLVGAKNT